MGCHSSSPSCCCFPAPHTEDRSLQAVKGVRLTFGLNWDILAAAAWLRASRPGTFGECWVADYYSGLFLYHPDLLNEELGEVEVSGEDFAADAANFNSHNDYFKK